MRRLIAVLAFCAAVTIAAPSQVFTTLVTFDHDNGANPDGALILATDGNFYGVTASGGDHFSGTIFRMTPEGTLATVYSFCAQYGCPDGSFPVAPLLQASDGNFYGVTLTGGGVQHTGTIFRITPGGVLTTLHSFVFAEGSGPNGGLIEASDGNFYGTTGTGGAFAGTVFRITPDGMLTVLHNFGSADGLLPETGLVQASDGNLYGTTSAGGADNWGTIFRISLTGTLTTLHSFCAGTCTDGARPLGALIQASDGNLYGTTAQGPPNISGTVFKITLQGELTTIHAISTSEGGGPTGALVQATDGNFYGTTVGPCGGSYCDTVFEVSPEGYLTTLHTFNSNVDGQGPHGMMQAPDFNFYGETVQGASYGVGTIFRLLAYAPLSLVKLGSGTVTSVDGHIYCGADCSYNFSGGQQVVLSAVPSSGYTFGGWTGCDNVNGSYCYVTMTGARNVTATFTAANITLTSLTLKPSYVKGGQLSAGTLALSVAAPPGGVTVALSSDHPGAAHPPSFVFVPEGKSLVQFAVRTFPVKSNTPVTITANAGASQVSGTLTVGTTSLPPSIQ